MLTLVLSISAICYAECNEWKSKRPSQKFSQEYLPLFNRRSLPKSVRQNDYKGFMDYGVTDIWSRPEVTIKKEILYDKDHKIAQDPDLLVTMEDKLKDLMWIRNTSKQNNIILYVTPTRDVYTTPVVFNPNLKMKGLYRPEQQHQQPYMSEQDWLRERPWRSYNKNSPIPYDIENNVSTLNSLPSYFPTAVTSVDVDIKVQNAIAQWMKNITNRANLQGNMHDSITLSQLMKRTNQDTFARNVFTTKNYYRMETKHTDLKRTGEEVTTTENNEGFDDDPAYNDATTGSFDFNKHLDNVTNKPDYPTSYEPIDVIEKLKMDVASREEDHRSLKVQRVAELFWDKRQRQVGYTTIATTRILELFSTAPDEVCNTVFMTTYGLLYNMKENGTLDVLGEPAKSGLLNFVTLIAGSDVVRPRLFREVSTNLLRMVVNQEAHFIKDTLKIVSDAEELLNEEEGLNLFVKVAELVEWVEAHDTANISDRQALQGIYDAAMAPLVRLHGTKQLLNFLGGLTKLLEKELPPELVTAVRRNTNVGQRIFPGQILSKYIDDNTKKHNKYESIHLKSELKYKKIKQNLRQNYKLSTDRSKRKRFSGRNTYNRGQNIKLQ